MALFQDVKESTDGSAFVNVQDGSGNALSSTGGSLNVNITGGSSSGAAADGDAFTYGSSTETPVGGVFNDTGATVTSGDTAAVRITAQRGFHVNLRNASGSEIGAAGASGVFVKPHDGTNAQVFTAAGEAQVSVTQPLPAGTNLIGKATISQGGNDATVTASNALKVDGSAVTQPISAASLPLPTGASTEATLAAISGKMSPANASLTQVARSATSVSVLAANSSRKGFMLQNDSNAKCYVAFAATASTSAYSVVLHANSLYECPAWVYTGQIAAIWASGGAGNLIVTELS